MRTRAWAGMAMLAGSTMIVPPAAAHEAAPLATVSDFVFSLDYRLPGQAGAVPLNAPAAPDIPADPLHMAPPPPVVFMGMEPTDRKLHLLATESFPAGGFAIETLILDHVNQPVGALVGLLDHESPGRSPVTLTYWEEKLTVRLMVEGQAQPVLLEYQMGDGLKEYLYHAVLSYDGRSANLYINGELKATGSAPGGLVIPRDAEFEAAAYLGNEPYMEMGNLVRQVRVHADPMAAAAVEERFAKVAEMIEEGVLYEDFFHFTVPPYLHFATQRSMNLLFETESASTAVVEWGTELPLEMSRTFDEPERMHEMTLEGLEPATAYLYRVMAMNEAGEQIESGLLSFRTAVEPGSAYRFAVFADTEARPHINNRIAQLVWSERPDFAMNFGDLTDGGFANDRFQWTHEYFAGMGALHGRVPVYTVPGNGESDLVWYGRYHRYPGPENYYKFEYGNATFFMLDSNRPMGPGSEQYAWLEGELKNTETLWKFAGHHHPTYTSDENDYGNTWEGGSAFGDDNVRGILPLYEGYGVDMVFFGHLHTYERSFPIKDGQVSRSGGVVYIQCGGAGGNLEDFSPTRTWFSRKTYRGHHYGLVAINGPVLEFNMYDTEGRLRDTFTIEKDESALAMSN